MWPRFLRGLRLGSWNRSKPLAGWHPLRWFRGTVSRRLTAVTATGNSCGPRCIEKNSQQGWQSIEPIYRNILIETNFQGLGTYEFWASWRSQPSSWRAAISRGFDKWRLFETLTAKAHCMVRFQHCIHVKLGTCWWNLAHLDLSCSKYPLVMTNSLPWFFDGP